MSSINTSNYWSSSASTNKGMSGLVSGMDTESMVEQMLSGTQSKIDAQQALKQQTLWKQEIYRDMITTINDFRNKYFNFSVDASSSKNFASSAFFNTMQAAVKSGSGLNVVGADSSALTGDMRVKIKQLAETASIESASTVSLSPDKVEGDVFTKGLNTLTLNFKQKMDDGTTKDVAVDVDLTGATDMNQVVQKITKALSDEKVDGVLVENIDGKLQFTVNKDNKFTYQSAGGSQFAMAMAGFNGGSTIETNSTGQSVIKVKGKFEQDPKVDMTFDVNLDGITKTITLKDVTAAQLQGADVIDSINDQLKKAFGVTGGEQNIKVERVGDDISGYSLKFTMSKKLTDEKGHSFTLTGADLTTLGITPGSSSVVSYSTKLSDLEKLTGTKLQKVEIDQEEDGTPIMGYAFTLNGETFKFKEDATLGDVINGVNDSDAGVKISYSALSDTFVMETTSSGAGFSISVDDDQSNVLNAIFGNISKGTKVAGKDAIVEVNGVETTRSSNTFTINGITMELTKANPAEEIVIGTERDIDTIVEGFKSFVEDYNAMLEKLNGYMDEDPDYKDYAPLTDAQKKEMTENQIKLWEEKAKKGLVRRDSTVEAFLSEMRTIMYTTPGGSNISLYNIGIETGNYKDQGKLVLDETALRNALASNPGGVEQLFTQAQDGLAKLLDNSLKNVANTSSGSPGMLVQMAGLKGYSSEKNNTLSQQITSIEDRIEQLKSIYEKQKERYWKQFNTMERVLANMSAQSNYLSSQFFSY